MKVCTISKYPPIQGGISSHTYWLTRGIAKRGVEVHVVTNANCVENEYQISDEISERYEHLFVHYVIPEIPWHIPYSELYVPRLVDASLEVLANNKIDIIDTNYLIPYGIVGYLLSNITGTPYIVRHGGSDIAKFINKGVLKHLLKDVIRNAAAIVTDEKNKGIFEALNSNIHVLPRYIPDSDYFKPNTVSRSVPVFAHIGKINYYWKQKSLDRLVEIFAGVENEHMLRFVGQGNGYDEFCNFVRASGLKRYELKEFVHPANMPRLLDQTDFLICFSQNNPIQDYSNIVCEAIWSGITLILDEKTDVAEYERNLAGTLENQIIRLNIDNIEASRKQIESIIDSWDSASRVSNKIDYDYDRYIDTNLEVYSSVKK